jgi:hypothetical protein
MTLQIPASWTIVITNTYTYLYTMAEKTQVPAPSAFSPYLETVASLFHPVAGPVYNSSARFHGWKESLGLVQPGTVENLTREVSRMSCRHLWKESAYSW